MVDELTEITRELLASPFDEFTKKRNTRIRELKRAGAAVLAAAVQQLRRPALSLWAANQLVTQPALLAAVRDATLAAAEAQSRASEADLRDAMTRLRRALDEVERAAAELGRLSSEEHCRRVREVVRLAALSDATWQRLALGALIEEPEPVLGFAIASGARSERALAPPVPSASQRARESDLREARRIAARDTRAAEDAQREARRLRDAAGELRERVEVAEQLAREAEAAATQAQAHAAASRGTLEALQGE
ncbi:MAG: hypothetical protein U0360_08000 [Dehalococcoidia bacterium]